MTAKREGPTTANGQALSDSAQPQSTKPMRYRWWDAIMADDELGMADFAVAMALSVHGRLDGTSIYPSKERLARECKASERTVYRALRNLIERGYLVDVSEIPKAKRSAMRLSTVYRLALPSPGNPSVHPKAPDTDDRATDRDDSEHLTQWQTNRPWESHPSHEHSATHVAGAPHGGAPQPSLDDYEDEEEYVEDAVDGYDGCEESTALGMIANGVHPRAVINKILAERREAAAYRRRAA